MARFEWDEEKRKKTLTQRGLDFADAHIAFEDDYAFSAPDPRYDSDERWLLIGRLKESAIVVIAYKEIDADAYRIISMRMAEKTEKMRYEIEKANQMPLRSDPLTSLLEELREDRELAKELALLEEEAKQEWTEYES